MKTPLSANSFLCICKVGSHEIWAVTHRKPRSFSGLNQNTTEQENNLLTKIEFQLNFNFTSNLKVLLLLSNIFYSSGAISIIQSRPQLSDCNKRWIPFYNNVKNFTFFQPVKQAFEGCHKGRGLQYEPHIFAYKCEVASSLRWAIEML